MRNKYFFSVLCFFSLFCNELPFLNYYLRINITINENAQVLISEILTVNSHGIQLIDKLTRTFPQRYEIVSVTKDGSKIPYEIESQVRGKGKTIYHVIIGNGAKLKTENHTYQITYKRDDMIYFYEHNDAFYYTISYDNWYLPITKIGFSLHLPKAINPQSITTNIQQQGQKIETLVKENSIFFIHTNTPEYFKDITLNVSWEKGVLERPFYKQPFFFWLFSILIYRLLITFFLMTLLLSFFRRYWYNWRNKRTIITPVFYPPEHLSPSMVGFIYHSGFTRTFFPKELISADLIQLAVEGYITINHTSSLLKDDSYTLSLIHTNTNDQYKITLLKTLFSDSETCSIPSDRRKIRDFDKEIFNHTKKESRLYLKKLPSFSVITAILIGISIFVFRLWEYVETSQGIIFLTLLAIWGYTFDRLSYRYTENGKRVQEQIEGFKRFLVATEKQQLHFDSQSPAKTAELYERYLPYAIALEVESFWQEQFPFLFDSKETGITYTPSWYFSTEGFHTKSLRHLSLAIASAFRKR